MDQKYDNTPEVAPQNFPEVAYHQQGQPYQQPPYQQPPYQQSPYQDQPYQGTTPPQGYQPPFYGVPKEGSPPFPGAVDSATVYSAHSPYQQHVQPVPVPGPASEPERREREESRVMGCTSLVFFLSCLIVLLSCALIGLAAGTGVEANRANGLSNQVAVLSASLSNIPSPTTVTVSPSSTPFNQLDNGCSNNPNGVTKTSYTAFSLFGTDTYTIFCNSDAPGSPLLSLFTADFNSCMDACASWSKYMPAVLNSTTSVNATCEAVSFIPLWTVRANASAGGAPGNCYLKPGPQNESALSSKSIGTEVHCALLASSSPSPSPKPSATSSSKSGKN